MNNLLERHSTIGGYGKYREQPSRSTASASSGQYQPSPLDFINSFYAVLRRWESETAFISNPDEITSHPSFRALVENADTVVSLIIGELKQHPSFLVWVLDDAFGERPYPDEAMGDIPAMTEAWIAWAERNGRTI